MPLSIQDYKTPIEPTWCPGCGDFGIFLALRQALSELDIKPHEVIIVYDIGCSGNMADKLHANGFKSLHGRAVPTAVGVKLANSRLPVIVIGGDGGLMEEGVQHTLWAARSNYDITVILHDNQVFGLTTGQPTTGSEKGQPSITPYGITEQRISPCQLMLTAQANFVARGFAGDAPHLKKLIKKAIQHTGFSFLDALQPCVTYNRHNSYEWFRQRIHKLDENKKYDPTDKKAAFANASVWEDAVVTGVLYEQKVPSYEDQLPHRNNTKTTLVEEVKSYDIAEALKEFE